MWENILTKVLRKNYLMLNIVAFIAAFICYFSVYGFRKPFTSATFTGLSVFGIDYKIALIFAQVIGYALSKFWGIKFISELNPNKRGKWIIILILTSEISLIFFAIFPTPYNCFWMILNGFPLGFIWGLVFSYLEGRRTSEILGSGMSISFIISSGAVKSVGRSFLSRGISQWWMPAFVGCIFFLPLLISTLILESLPPPDEKDIAARSERVIMNRNDRINFFKKFWPGFILWILFYMLLTAFRDFRDNFAPELWVELGYENTPGSLTISELIVALVICIPIGLFMLIKKQIVTLIAYHIKNINLSAKRMILYLSSTKK